MRLYCLVCASFLLSAYSLVAQDVPTEPPTGALYANQVIESALLSSGGRAALRSVQDFRESGSITYNWGLEPLHGSASISAIGTSEFRFDFNVPGQDRSWFVTHGQGKSKQNGRISPLPFHAGANRGSLTLPVLRLASAAISSEFQLSYVGKVTRDGRDLHQVRVEKIPSASEPNEKLIAQLETTEYFIDSSSFLIIRIEDVAHPPENMEVSQLHAIDYSDYRKVDGIQVPFSVIEHIGNAEIWSLQMNDVNLNVGINRSDVEF